MQFNISIIAVEKNSATSKAGKPYQLIELSYKNLQSGKVEGTKINQYSNIYAIASGAQQGEQYIVTKEKVGEFWNWTSLVKSDKFVEVKQDADVKQTSATVRSNYETAEERAAKQVYIVKQSSLSNAVATLSVGSKSLDPEKVIEVAQRFTDWVFDKQPKKIDLQNTPNDLPEDDIPF